MTTNNRILKFASIAAGILLTAAAGSTAAFSGLFEPAYANPILASEDLADPTVIAWAGKYYMYGTYLDGSLDGGSNHFDVYVSDDMKNWQKGPVVFSSNTRTLWAPDVFRNPADGNFYLYYSNDMGIGVAVSSSPTGPFTDLGKIIDHAIDAHMFHENGNYYLYYASVEIDSAQDMIARFLFGLITLTGDKAREDIFVQKMSSPTTKSGNPVLLLWPTQAWEKGILLDVNEGPWMYKTRDTYYLMYSGNEAMFGDYAVGYATSKSPMGPFVKYTGNPIVKKRDGGWFEKGVYSPGHNSVVRDANGVDWFVYHQKKNATDIGFSFRYTCRDKLVVDPISGVLSVRTTAMRDF